MVFLKLLSRLPLWVLYILSDFLYLLFFYILGYRKNVVLDNLGIAFPDKSDREKRKIRRDFYRHFFDLIVEFFAIRTMSVEELAARVEVNDFDSLKKYFESNQSVIVVVSHHANWEWMLQRGCTTLKFPLDAVYQKLSNKKINDFIFETRSRFGGLPIEMKQTFKEIVKRKNTTRGFCMVADQSPSKGKSTYFIDFFGKETPFYTGMASIHEMTKYPLLFASMHKKKRGYYEISMEVISDSPSGVKEFAVVNEYARLVEKQIRMQPECYLWTHKRWKFAK